MRVSYRTAFFPASVMILADVFESDTLPIRTFLFAYLFIQHFIIGFKFQSCFSSLRGSIEKIESENL